MTLRLTVSPALRDRRLKLLTLKPPQYDLPDLRGRPAAEAKIITNIAYKAMSQPVQACIYFKKNYSSASADLVFPLSAACPAMREKGEKKIMKILLILSK